MNSPTTLVIDIPITVLNQLRRNGEASSGNVRLKISDGHVVKLYKMQEVPTVQDAPTSRKTSHRSITATPLMTRRRRN
jgi:hypothetical protein